MRGVSCRHVAGMSNPVDVDIRHNSGAAHHVNGRQE